jgi:hypothetical protein
MLPDEKYDWAFGIKVREAGEVFIVIFFLYLFFFFFIVLTGLFGIKVREGWEDVFRCFF